MTRRWLIEILSVFAAAWVIALTVALVFGGATRTFTVTTTATAVTVQSDSREITVGEDPSVAGWPTGDWVLRQPFAASAAVRRASGTTWTFKSAAGTGGFAKGEVVGYVAVVSGSTTFFQIEQ